jgi:hypothetical protein
MVDFPFDPRLMTDVAAPCVRMRSILEQSQQLICTDASLAGLLSRWINMAVKGLSEMHYEVPSEIKGPATVVASCLAKAVADTSGTYFFEAQVKFVDNATLGRLGQSLVSSGFIQAADELWKATWGSGCWPVPFQIDYETSTELLPPKPSEESASKGGKACKIDNEKNNLIKSFLSVFTDGVSDERLDTVCRIARSESSADKKLKDIESLFPIPPTTSAKTLGDLLGVSKPAIMKTNWWVRNRKGKKSEKVDWRENHLLNRGECYEEGYTRDD